MSGSLLPLAKQIVLDNSANPGNGWKFFTYDAGTLTLKTTYQDAALTIANENPVIANARGEVTMYGSGTYRIILKDANDVAIYDRDNVEAPKGYADAVSASLTTLNTDLGNAADTTKGAAKIGYRGRTVHARLDDAVTIKRFSPVGDGVADDTTALTSFLAEAAGKEAAYLEPGKVYGFTGALTIPANVNLVTNGSIFKRLAAATSYAITVKDGVTVDRLKLECAGGADDRGIYIEGEASIGKIVVSAALANSGSSGSDVNALLVGPATGTADGVRIGFVKLTNWDRPAQFRNLTNFDIALPHITNYRRGVYVKDCTNGDFRGGNMAGLSANSTGGAGDNGLLIESVSADLATRNIRFYNITIDQSGEHGIRMGGNKVVDSVWFIAPKVTRPGFATSPSGGCGIKLQGDSTSGAYHTNIHLINPIVEDCKPNGDNYAALHFTMLRGLQVVGPIVRKRTLASSALHGLSFLSCDDVTVTGPDVIDCQAYACYFRDAAGLGFPAAQNNITISGGRVGLSGVANTSATVRYECGTSVFTNVSLLGGVQIIGPGGNAAVVAAAPGTGGSYTRCSLDIQYMNPPVTTGGPPTQGTNAFLVNIKGPYYGTFQPTAADGSLFQDPTGGTFRIRKAGNWTTL